ncbi:MAG: hypothetical protein JWN29_2238, partial [Acidimicrobiales bacterium]|nr:hypothetical protein [Acidimicrobiales bacterium]
MSDFAVFVLCGAICAGARLALPVPLRFALVVA